jgi:hypothetical protein
VLLSYSALQLSYQGDISGEHTELEQVHQWLLKKAESCKGNTLLSVANSTMLNYKL